MPLERIVSGGQTGVDRGALDAALAARFPCGGWCPAGRRAEDGTIPADYPLTTLPRRDYRTRTRRNVLDSDGTVILRHGVLQGGTALTQRYCDELRRPCLTVDAEAQDVEAAVRLLSRFVERWAIRVLNVAGPRASKWGGAHAYAQAVVAALICSAAQSNAANQAAPKKGGAEQ
ncbi:putative molybdenum carrier protein [Ectothiorhodospiraceae bacterium WFHF3C12]|nr:putative molybdenum carrier protein [Ectothiorhodospiraceae bacterium WFHF3C12]